MKLFRVIMAVTALLLFAVPALAEEYDIQSELYFAEDFDADSIIEALPREVREQLPSGDLFSPEGIDERFSVDYFLDLIKTAAVKALSPMMKMLSMTLGLIILSSALNALGEAVRSDQLLSVTKFVSGLTVMLTLYGSIYELAKSLKLYLTQLGTIVNTMVPVMLAASIAGGNITSGTVSANAMMLGLSFIEALAAKGLFPIVQLCFGVAVADSMGGGLKLSGISKLTRSCFAGVMAFISALISAVMTFQNSIALKADSLSMRAVKFAAAKAVPVAGGIASEAVAAVAGSLSLVKSTVGFVGIVIIAVLTLPIIINIIMTRLGVIISRVCAEVLGLERERQVLDEMCGLLGFFSAVSFIAALVFIYAISVFAGSAAMTSG